MTEVKRIHGKRGIRDAWENCYCFALAFSCEVNLCYGERVAEEENEEKADQVH